MFDFSGKTIAVTGGGSGMGRETVRKLVDSGANVAVLDLRLDAAKEVAAEANSRKSEGRAFPVAVDVADAPSVEAAFSAVVDEFGTLFGLVNCAGIALGEGGVVECKESAWDKTMDVNVKGIFLTGKYAIPHMVEAGQGAVVNIASVFGFVVNKDECAYAASKGAVVNLTRQMAVQHAKDGVRVNAVCPSDADTPLIASLLGTTGEELEKGKAELASPIPMGHLAKVEDIADAILYLLSDHSKFITGVNLPVDGGFLLQ